MNQSAHTGDDQKHQEAERIDEHTEVNGETGDLQPLNTGRDNFYFRIVKFCKQHDAANEANGHGAHGEPGAHGFVALGEQADEHSRSQRQKENHQRKDEL